MTYKSLAGLAAVAIASFASCLGAEDSTFARKIADLNPGSVGSFPSNFITFNGALYFSAYTLETGREFWKYDGANVLLVTNINDATHDDGAGNQIGNDSVPAWFTLFNGAIYFSAYDQRRGGELWRYDGTRAVRVADINPDMNDTIKFTPQSSWPQELTVMGNALYFSADNGGVAVPNYELWRYDGLTVSMVTNIHRDFATNHSSYPNHMKAFNNALYFMADDGLNGYELWKHSSAGTVLFNLNLGDSTSSSYPKLFTPYKNQLYFQAYDDLNGFELWRTDGTVVSLVTNLHPFGSSFPEFFTVFKDSLYFRADNGTAGSELWKYNGTNFALLADLNPFGDSTPQNLTVFQDNLIFAANDGVHGFELWKYDGTSVSLVTNLNPTGDSFPETLTAWNNRLFFTATNEVTGYELWQYDGQTITLAADINPGSPSSFPFNLAGFGSELCFSANDSYFYDWELWSLKTAPFRIIRIEQLPTGIRLTWATLGGTTNVVQAADTIDGPFQDLSEPFPIQGTSETTTNYMDTTDFSPGTSRFYRIVRP